MAGYMKNNDKMSKSAKKMYKGSKGKGSMGKMSNGSYPKKTKW